MRKVRLALDLDGVIYRWSDTANYLLSEYWGEDPGESLDWDWIKNHVSEEAWKWLWTDGIKHGLFRYGSLFRGSREFLKRISEYCDNVVITSRPSVAAQDTMDWLSYQRIPTNEIHIVGAGEKKSSVLPHCDVYLDDASHNAEDILQNTNAVMILTDKPWNQDFKSEMNMAFHRSYSWSHIEEILQGLHRQINAE